MIAARGGVGRRLRGDGGGEVAMGAAAPFDKKCAGMTRGPPRSGGRFTLRFHGIEDLRLAGLVR
jgi:hypothetical protein